MHHGTTPSAFTRLNVGSAALLGIRPDAYAGLPGLAPPYLDDDRYRTPAATNVRLWELMVAHTPWPAVAELMADRSHLGRLGVWDYLLTSAPTPLDGIRDAVHHLAAAADAGTEALTITDDGQHITLSHLNTAELTYEAASAIRSYALGLLRRRIGEAAGRPIVPVRVTLAAEAPRRHGALTGLYGTRAVDFESAADSITFRAADLRRPAPHAQPGLSELLRRHAEQALATAVPLHTWIDLFRAALRTALEQDGDVPTLASTSRRLSVGSRTLQRRLEEHGTSWRAELDAARRAHVTRLLTATDQTLDAIAARNGYADARTLRRAVRRWTGRTPSALRKGAAG
ncbi:AraC family transcriptional regulator [Streptomyces roseicoloratus]|uniref:AraC family transcriptional regulator n=1 Tax=Streptomyces roseicoloratus TaxID=2508722 RepID=UPI0013E981BE|nr:AraC family transcriptional regulator [Streptomyces roseicoloratus]